MESFQRVNEGGLIYEINTKDNKASVVGFDSNLPSNVLIPRLINHESQECLVTSISENAFKYCEIIKSLHFPTDSEILKIESNAFYKTEIDSFTIPSKLEELDEKWHDDAKFKRIDVSPDNKFFKIVDDQFLLKKSSPEKETYDILLYFYCKDTREVNLPDCIEVIESYSFYQCPLLKRISISENSNLRSIKKSSFYEVSIDNLYIPPKMVEINEPFYYFHKLEKIVVSPNNRLFKTIDDKILLKKSSLEKTDFDIICLCVHQIECVLIPTSIKIIDSSAFSQCSVECVDFEPNQNKIRKHSSLPFFFLEKNENSNSSEKCNDFKTIPLLKEIRNHAFIGSLIEHITIPDSVKIIGDCAFCRCYNLREFDLSIKSNLEIIGQGAFLETPIQRIFIPPRVKIIGESAFENILNLEDVYFSSRSALKIIGKRAFAGTPINQFSIPSSVEVIDEKAFFKCSNLEEIEIPCSSNLRSIKKGAFSHTSIDNFFIPSKLEELEIEWHYFIHKLNKVEVSPENHHFVLHNNQILLKKSESSKDNFDTIIFCNDNNECSNVQIPDYVEIIESGSFVKCQNIVNIEITENSNLKIIKENAFVECSIQSIFIPSKVVMLENEWCSKMKNLKKVVISHDNKNYKSIDDQIILKKSSPEKENFDILSFCVLSAKNVHIPSYVEVIEPKVFENCKSIENLEIPPDSKLKIIGANAFYYLSIKSISIPAELEQIDESAFEFCKNLQIVEIPPNSKLQIVKKSAFAETSIKEIKLPPLKHIGEQIFQFCSNLLHVEFSPNSICGIIPSYAFQSSGISSFSLPSSFTKICSYSFASCKKLKNISIPENSELQVIKKSAFFNCGIESLYIPSKLVTLESGWCDTTDYLTKIEISPNNKNYILYQNQFILGKTSPEVENFNVLSFCVRNAKGCIVIPNFIEVIHSYAFFKCKSIKKIEFQRNSKLQIIQESAFNNTSIKKISIPSHVKEIHGNAFGFCSNLERIEFDDNSELQVVHYNAFYESPFKSIIIPPKVSAFELMFYNSIQIVEIDEKSEMQNIKSNMLHNSHAIAMIPIQLKNNMK